MRSLHSDWATEPIAHPFQPLPSRDRSHAYIIGKSRDGKRYCRTVEVMNSMNPTGGAQAKLELVLQKAIEGGPSVCIPVDGGECPPEAAQPPLDC